MKEQTPVLQAKSLGISFSGLNAVSDFDITIYPGELVGLIGPNGAGKTTVFNLLTGVYQPTQGEFYIEGKKITRARPYKMVDAGVARTFQNIRLFKQMSVIDNVKVAFNRRMRYSLLSGALRLNPYWREETDIHQRAMELLDLFEMCPLANQLASNLPYGMQRKLEIARALATGAKLLLLDEPAAGMNPTETAELMGVIHTIREKFGISILLIEHDMSLVMSICQRLVVIDYGKIIATGTPAQIAQDEKVIGAYLGK